MSADGDKTHYTSVFRLSSPSDTQRVIVKRNRRVVSCVPCRNRKLKCDRQEPCAACIKRHDEASCKFFKSPAAAAAAAAAAAGSAQSRGGVNANSGQHGSPPPAAGQKNEMRARLKMLEDLVSGMMGQSQPLSHSHGATDRTRPSPVVETLPGPRSQQETANTDELQTHGNKTRSERYDAVLNEVRDLQGFINADFARPVTATATLHSRPTTFIQAQEKEPRGILEEVLRQLPQRAECDSILCACFQQIYLIPTVCHAGQFQRIYEQFWKHPASVNPLWLSMLFSLISTSYYQQAAKKSPSDTSSATPSAETMSRAADCSSMAYRCLVAGNHLQGGPFSVEATLIFGMHLVLQKRDSDPFCWHMISTAIRIAQRAGYHRDAAKLDRNGFICPFEAEMRRRTWSYLEYFDVHFSFQSGIPPIINVDFVDASIPTNLRDEDFDEETKVLPPPRSTTELTPSLVYVTLAKQIKSLHRVVQQALALKQPSYVEVMALHDELSLLHNEIPPALRWRRIKESGLADIPDVIFRRIMLETMHLKSLCILHRRYLTFGRQNDAYERSRIVCVDASLGLLQIQIEFDENSGEGGRLYERRYLLTNLGYHDFLLAAMCICLDLVIGSRDGYARLSLFLVLMRLSLIKVSTSSKIQAYERKVEALKQARAIWSRMADQSTEAAHASQVLDLILSRVPSSDERRDPGIKRVQKTPASSTPTTSVNASEGSNLSTSESPRFASHLTPNSTQTTSQGRSISNTVSSPADIAPGWSREWNFGRWDEITDGLSRSSGASSEATSGLGVDWVSCKASRPRANGDKWFMSRWLMYLFTEPNRLVHIRKGDRPRSFCKRRAASQLHSERWDLRGTKRFKTELALPIVE